jgi:hypothetical protein
VKELGRANEGGTMLSFDRTFVTYWSGRFIDDDIGGGGNEQELGRKRRSAAL